jgi:hypothetical protein
MTYAQIVQAIKDYTENYDTTFVSQIDTFIKQAEKRIYNACRVLTTVKSANSTLVVGNRFLSTPTDFLSAYELLVTVGSAVYPVQFRDVSYIREMFPTPPTNSYPRYYGLYDENTFLLSPTPDDTYAVELHYSGYPESIVTATTTWVGDNYEHVLLYGCLVEAYTFMKGESELLNLYDAKFKEGLQQIKTMADVKERTDEAVA